jgi:glyoxylase-like metal-dependent hydrolase (beta-lactamase superfamily II)
VAATQATLAIHPLELPLLRHGGGAREFGLPARPCQELGLLLEAGQVLEASSMRFEVLLVPGHSAGHVAYYTREANVGFSGDVLCQEGIGRTDFPGGDYATLMRSIREELFALPDDTQVCSGHGPVTTMAKSGGVIRS